MFSDPNDVVNEKSDESSVRWEPITTTGNENNLKIGRKIEMRTTFKDGRMEKLRNIFAGIRWKCVNSSVIV